MEEDEDIDSYFSKLLEISNESHVLGDPLSNKQAVYKATRSLTKCFEMKRIAVETSENLATMDLQTLMNIMKTFELGLDNSSGVVRDSSVALKAQALETIVILIR